MKNLQHLDLDLLQRSSDLKSGKERHNDPMRAIDYIASLRHKITLYIENRVDEGTVDTFILEVRKTLKL